MPLKNSTSGAGLSYGMTSLPFAALLLAGVFVFKVDFYFAGSLDRIDHQPVRIVYSLDRKQYCFCRVKKELRNT
jgi:hypothetical protein